ncbi:hypothetical protein LOTGIDRAFT_157965 [Lottia gigantea]|uniref:Uncharacterized protein n=1 Tax=Lottia gigantea TaxID=225164 RepID=V4CF84_LOTGI|nr:hypothetical protein LOTGIDRAFT_157965 [Lottia gigantea]ESP00675.1 hypothetical protein LOTGIDRAFT_157965 [Lottia gigantea]
MLPDHQLSYAAREMACHFIDVYKDRLQDDSDHLKVHCYRAAFQHIVIKLHPEFDRGKIKLTVKHATDLPFEKYCKINLKKLGYNEVIPQDLMLEAKVYLKQWKNVMSFYTIRLALSPVLETIILLDRMLYLYQHGITSILVPIFDPKISPRNFLLLSHKT